MHTPIPDAESPPLPAMDDLPSPAPAASADLPSPPLPPRFDPRPNARQRALLLTLAAGGAVALAVAVLVETGFSPLLRHAGWFLLLYAALAAAGWLPSGSWLARRVDRSLLRWVRTSGTGYYGLMALAVFLPLEIDDARRTIAEFDWTLPTWRSLLRDVIGDFGADTLRNFIAGVTWPARLLPAYGLVACAATVAMTYGAFALGRRVLPHSHFDASAGGKKSRERAAR